jgi:hypothetical protein
MTNETMARQLGLLTRHQALAAGLSEAQVDRRVGTGRWLAVHPGVYRSAEAPASHDQAQLAAVLACGQGAAVSHRAAAARHGTRAFTSRLNEVSVPGDGRPRLRGVTLHRMSDLVPSVIQLLDGVPTTTAERTVIDLGMVVRLPLVARIVEEWLADRRLTVESLRRAIDVHRGRGRRGVGVARRALEDRVLGEAAGDSTDEHLLPLVLRDYGSPLPVHHQLVRDDDGRVVAEVDYAYVEEKLGLELLGYGPHTRTRQAYEAFLAKQNLLQRLDWLVLGYTPAMVRRRPWWVAREIEDTRAQRAHRLIVPRASDLA